MLSAVASIYANAMRRASRLPRGVLGLDSRSAALCMALCATLYRLAERDAEASDEEPADDAPEREDEPASDYDVMRYYP